MNGKIFVQDDEYGEKHKTNEYRRWLKCSLAEMMQIMEEFKLNSIKVADDNYVWV